MAEAASKVTDKDVIDVFNEIDANDAEYTKNQIAIMDIGSGTVKCGFSGEDAPRSVFNTMVGRPRHKGVMVGMGQPRAYVGDEVMKYYGILSIKHPIENGICVSWDDWEKVVHHSVYNELRIFPEEYPFLLPFTSYNLQSHRSKAIQILFETFNIPSLLYVSQDSCNLFSNGLINGISWDTGFGSSRIVPIYEGHVLYDNINYVPMDGHQITQIIMKQCAMGSYRQHYVVAEDIKCKYLSIPMQKYSVQNDNNSDPIKYEFPDGEILEIPNDTIYGVGEIFFEPKLFEDVVDLKGKISYYWMNDDIKETFDINKGVHDLIYDVAKRCDESVRKQMAENVVLSGGNAGFKGLKERLNKELNEYEDINLNLETNKLERMNYKFDIKCSDNPKYNVFIGASIYGELIYENEPSLFMYQQEYDEHGPEVLYRHKCF